MDPILDIAAYKFVALDDLPTLRERLLADAAAAHIKGTILLAAEGINLVLAGVPEDVEQFLGKLRTDGRFADLEVKRSRSATVPFKRMRVRIKREIIRMNHPTIAPASGRAAAVDALTLKRWLDAGRDDAGRPVLMLDTRNRFEIEVGRFHNALDLGLGRFSEFPDAVERVRERLAGHTVVAYCTGGIRCEKASLYLDELGVPNHWQLDGGILKYFELVGGAHFDGHCTVFDERAALDAELQPAG